MTTIELEQVIRDYILDIYKKEYTGKIYVKKRHILRKFPFLPCNNCSFGV